MREVGQRNKNLLDYFNKIKKNKVIWFKSLNFVNILDFLLFFQWTIVHLKIEPIYLSKKIFYYDFYVQILIIK